MEEAEAEAIGYQQSLSQIRNDFASMQTELTDKSTTALDNERGNSLFSEVDDRRQIVEVKLKRFKEQFETMKIQYDKKVQQLQRVRTQNVALLNRASADVNQDHGQLYHLEDLLERERNRSKILIEQIMNLENGTKQESNTSFSRTSTIDGESFNNQELLQLQIRQNLEADGKVRELTRKIAAMERSESKLRAENYQLRTELGDLRQTKNGVSGGATRNTGMKAKQGPTREFIKFKDDNEDKGGEEQSSNDHEKHLIRVLSADSKDKIRTSVASNTIQVGEKDKQTAVPRRAKFTEEDPVIFGDKVENGENTLPRGENRRDNYYKKKSELIAPVKPRKIVNTLINAKEESDKLKEQCAQQ